MANDLMTADEIQQWILRRLGAPFWKVELTSDHLTDAVETARRWFSAKKGVRRQEPMKFYASLPEYTLPDEVDTVLDVVFPANPMDISMVFSPYLMGDEKVPYDVFAAGNSGGLYSTYTQTLQYVEMGKRILNAEQDWRQEGRSLFLFPVPKSNGELILEYKSHHFTVEQLNERDHDLVKRYALAAAKKDLAQVRSRYAEFHGAQGMIQLNAGQLAAEADKEMEALEREISLSGFPLGFVAG